MFASLFLFTLKNTMQMIFGMDFRHGNICAQCVQSHSCAFNVCHTCELFIEMQAHDIWCYAYTKKWNALIFTIMSCLCILLRLDIHSFYFRTIFFSLLSHIHGVFFLHNFCDDYISFALFIVSSHPFCRCIDANSRPSLIEKIFLVVGMLCFFAMGMYDWCFFFY